MTEKMIGHTRVSLVLEDITKNRADAVVNAANPSLMGGGGVDGAIHRAGGPSIARECKAIITKIGRLAPGKAVVTNAGQLPARYVIHTVGPIWRGGLQNEGRILASAYRESLLLADKMSVKSVAFPSIATGAYGYPVAEAAAVALQEMKNYLETTETGLESVVFAMISRPDFKIFEEQLEKL